MKKTEFFRVEGNKINRVRRHCPKCGPGIFLAEHKDRFSCGKCGYTEFKSGGGKKLKEKQILETDKKPQIKQENESELKEEKESIDEHPIEKKMDESDKEIKD